MSSIKWTALGCLVLLVSSVARAAEPEPMLEEIAANAIAEYRSKGDAAVISRVVPDLSMRFKEIGQSAKDRNALLYVYSDLLNALYATADVNFDPDVKPAINSEFPGGRYRSGTDPRSVKDPALRAEYEKVVAKDRKYAEYYRRQFAIFDAIGSLVRSLRQELTDMSDREVRDLLVANGMKPAYGKDLLKRLEKRAPGG